MDLITQLLNNLKAQIEALQLQLADTSAAAAQIASENYDKGFADGVASMQSDKIYSQAELDAAIASVKSEMQLVIDGLNIQVLEAQTKVGDMQLVIDGMKAELDALKGDISKQVEAAIEGFKADLRSQFDAEVEAENALEAGFRKLLEAKIVEVPQPEPIPETPVEETPVEETPVEETPVEQPAEEPAPIEETPVDNGEVSGETQA